MSNLMTQTGFSYAFDPRACATCGGRCCTGESGNIFVSPAEIASIATVLGVSEEVCIERHMHKKHYRYSLNEVRVGESYDCCFFDRAHHGCTIYTARPMQCRTFPFWDYFRDHLDELVAECPGVVIHD